MRLWGEDTAPAPVDKRAAEDRPRAGSACAGLQSEDRLSCQREEKGARLAGDQNGQQSEAGGCMMEQSAVSDWADVCVRA